MNTDDNEKRKDAGREALHLFFATVKCITFCHKGHQYVRNGKPVEITREQSNILHHRK